MSIADNNVNVEGQVYDCFVKIFDRGANINVLFIGNSITWHLPKSEIGWPHNWGMAASQKDKDYVHLVLAGLEKKYGKVNYCIAQLGKWEKQYWNDEILNNYEDAKNFKADIIICRLGENIWGVRDMLNEKPLYHKFDNMIKFFKVNSEAKVLVTDLFWEWKDIDKVIAEVIKNNNYLSVKIGDLGADDKCKALGLFNHSGVAIHPGDYGMKKIAERILEKLLFNNN